MSKKTLVSDYIENKLNSIKKDSFLEENSLTNLSYTKQQELIYNEINSIYSYIKIIKENKKCYKIVNGRRVLEKPIKEYISGLRKIINKYFEYAKYLKLLERYQTRKELIEKRIEFESNEINLDDDKINILNHLDYENVKDIDFNTLGDIAKYLINNYESYNSKLELIIKELGSRYKYNEYSEESYIILSSVKGVINNKINSLDKKDRRRDVLKEYKKYIKGIIEIIREKDIEKYDYRYDIISYLMEDEYCFNRLLEEMPDIVNLKDKDGYSLSYNVLEKYLDIYLLELQGRSKGINKEEIIKIYHKIIKHPYYSDDYSNINEMLEHFKETIKNGRFRREKYIEVLNTLEDINKVPLENKKESKINNFDIEDERNYILNKSSSTNRVDLTLEDTIVLCTNKEKYYNYAYSVTKNCNGNHVLKVHRTTIRDFIKHGSMIDMYLRENMFKGENNWLDAELMDKFSLNKGEIKPALTFELEITPKGKVNNFKCYKSNIKVDDVYTYENVNSEIKKHNLRFIPYLEINYFLNKEVNKNNYASDMVNTFNKAVLDNIGSYFSRKSLPFIYKAQKEQDNSRYIRNMTTLNSIFSKISRDDFKKIYQIICDDINYSRYTSKPETHNALNQKYYSDLFIPLYSYIGIFLEEMINQFYLTHDTGEMLEIKKYIWLNEQDYIINWANEIKENKRNMEHKNKIKSLKEK